MSVLFKGGTVVNASGRYLADVFADGDKIKAIGTDLDNPADEIVDAKDKYILPGAIDPHTHLSMPFMGTYAQDDYETAPPPPKRYTRSETRTLPWRPRTWEPCGWLDRAGTRYPIPSTIG